MPNGVSEGYRRLTPEEVASYGADYEDAWQDPYLPLRQYERVVRNELEQWRHAEEVLPYRVLVDCLLRLHLKTPSLLDVGASAGYYREVLKIIGYHCDYTAIDFSEDFRRLALVLYPDIRFDVGDCRSLPYENQSFDVVLHSAVIMHVLEYPLAIAEAARVAAKYVIFHRTPVTHGPTAYFVKTAYDVPCLEIHFNEDELLGLFGRYNLGLIHSEQLFWSEHEKYGHRSYVLTKEPLFHHPV